MRGGSPRNRKVEDHEFNSSGRSFGRSGCPAVAGESLYSNAVIHQINSERRGSHCRGFMAAECVWTLSFSFPRARWLVKDGVETSPNAERTNHDSTTGNTADVCHKEIL